MKKLHFTVPLIIMLFELHIYVLLQETKDDENVAKFFCKVHE